METKTTGQKAFNSLFEMRRRMARELGRRLAEAFNSLFEMHLCAVPLTHVELA